MMQQRKGRALRAILVALSLMVLPAMGSGQVQQQSSVIDDLLKRAENSLNDLQYAQALGFAKQVLDLGAQVAPDKRERAMHVFAAANYPEGEPASQHRDVALATYKQMVRTKLDLAIPSALRWAGLDSVLADAKSTTFGMAVNAAPQQEVVGPAGRGEFRVRTSRPATYRLRIISASGSPAMVVNDSSGGPEAVLRFPAMQNDRPAFTTGDYEMVVTAFDRLSGDSISARYTAVATAPALTFATAPTTVDTSRYAAERTKKYGYKGVIVGALVAGGIYGLSSVVHADTSLKSKYGADSKGMGIAAAAGLSVIAASFMDKGRQIPSAIAANQRLRDDLATSIRNTQAENASRITGYKAVFAITPGDK